MNLLPGLQGAIPSRHLGVQIAVSEIKFPVGVLGVAHEIADASLEFGETDVGIQAGNEHSGIQPRHAARAGDAVVVDAGALEQRLSHLALQVGAPG
jgi:hypothetical protein